MNIYLVLITSILASLSYVEFVEHLWTIKLNLNSSWVSLNTNTKNTIPTTNPLDNTVENHVPDIIEILQGATIFTGILELAP